MRLHIEHITRYEYARPVTFGRHRLVLRPREGHDQRVERMQLRITPEHQILWLRDVFGNSIALVDGLAPGTALTIVNDLVVERFAPFPERAFHQPWRVPFPPEYDPLEVAVTSVYKAPAYLDESAAVQSWLAGHVVSDPGDAEGAMQALCETIHRTVAYQRRAERGVQSPAQTLALGSGSCRDMATLMMEAARHLGVAARFASGYLHGSASLAGRASTHAWTEVYLPTLGWRGFDPTIGAATSLQHIVTGVSSHPRGVMPVSGVFTGTRADCLRMDVTVRTKQLDSLAALPAITTP